VERSRRARWIAIGAVALFGLVCWLARECGVAPSGDLPKPSPSPAHAVRKWEVRTERAEEPRGPEPEGAAWIAGTVHVVDSAGRAVAGAEVRVQGEQEDVETAGLTPERYAAFMESKEAFRQAAGIRTKLLPGEPVLVTLARGRTDSSGDFPVHMIVDVGTVVTAWDARGKEGVAPMQTLTPHEIFADGRAVAAGRLPGFAGITVEIATPAVISGRVNDEHGRPIESATVRVERRNGNADDDAFFDVVVDAPESMHTDANGNFRIALRIGGEYVVSADAEGFEPRYARDGVSLERSEQGTVTIVLRHASP
jgi:hypothetical protein